MHILEFLLVVVPFVVCYALGGQGKTWLKKWVGPSVLAVTSMLIALLVHKFGWLVAFGSLAYIGAAQIPYGDKITGGKLWGKILIRGLYGLAYGLCALIISLGTHHAIIGAFQVILATAGSIGFGVWNPFPSKLGNWAALAADACIALSAVILVPFLY